MRIEVSRTKDTKLLTSGRSERIPPRRTAAANGIRGRWASASQWKITTHIGSGPGGFADGNAAGFGEMSGRRPVAGKERVGRSDGEQSPVGHGAGAGRYGGDLLHHATGMPHRKMVCRSFHLSFTTPTIDESSRWAEHNRSRLCATRHYAASSAINCTIERLKTHLPFTKKHPAKQVKSGAQTLSIFQNINLDSAECLRLAG